MKTTLPSENLRTFLGVKESTAEARRRVAEAKRTGESRLDLSDLNLQGVPPEVRNLRLGALEIGGKRLRSLPKWLSEFTDLRTLVVSDTNFSAIPAVIQSLKQLRKLSFVRSKVTEIPDWIGDFPRLRYLSLAYNPMRFLPDAVARLEHLEGLMLSGCRLETLPANLTNLTQLREIYLDNNPHLGLPEELVRGRQAPRILEYYSRIRPSAVVKYRRVARTPLNEFKLVLVGRGGVGKTTLVHKLITNKFKRFERTEGITITDWQIKCGQDQVRAHIWDFGGQEIMHGTHRFFITARSLYLVLLSARENTEDSDAEYWLSLVRSLAGDVPIIVVLNKYRELPFEVNRALLREKFGKHLRFLECDALENYSITELRQAIAEEANEMPELRKAFPAQWLRIKNELPGQRRDWMAFDEFVKFCSSHGEMSRKGCELLAGYLHDLGVMLSYLNDEALKGFGVLNPHWVTNGIYRIITSQELKKKDATLTIADFRRLLPASEYPAQLHPYLLALMRNLNCVFLWMTRRSAISCRNY